MDLLQNAITIANEAHFNQFRQHSKLPYIVHPIQVMGIYLESFTHDDRTILSLCACILHDVVEDCDPKYISCIQELGDNIYQLVMEVTNPSIGSKLPRAERKKMDREHIKKASTEGKRIKLIDRLCNLRDFNKETPNSFIKKYKEESQLLLDECLQDVHIGLQEQLQFEIY